MTLYPEELQQRWRAVVKRFPVWRLPFDLFFDPDSWKMVGVDLVSFMLTNKNARAAAAELEGASKETLDALASMAAVNVARNNEIFRAVILGYVSVPIALAAMLSDAAPDALRAALDEHTASIVIIVIGGVVLPILYFCGAWRAKQAAWVIDLYRAGAMTPLAKKRR